MDELTVIRSTRDHTREPSPEVLARGRAALSARIDSETPVALFTQLGNDTAFTTLQVRRRRRTVAWAGFSALGAASVTVALVATNVLGFAGWNGGADPAAARVLESASEATLEFSDPVVGPDQYLLVRTHAVYAGTEFDGDVLTGSQENSVRELYVPGDRTRDWVFIGCGPTVTQIFGPKYEARPQRPDYFAIFPAGVAPSGTWGGYSTGDGNGGSHDYGALPRDPKELLQAIYKMNRDSGESRDGQVLGWMADTLRHGTVPADLRAAIYIAAAEVPGVTIAEEEANLNGMTGVAIGRFESASNTRQDIIIDRATGQFIGERRVNLDSIAGFPAGTVTESTAVTSTVVDAAPSDASTCEK